MREIKVIELFAGIGAYSKALKRLKIPHKVVSAIEYDEKTTKYYNLIHNTNFKPIDITQVDEKELPDCDIICYSPPCQAFSIAGKQLGFEDKRGILFFDALRIIKEKQPLITIMENVKGLTQKKFKNEFAEMLKSLEEAGYKNYWKVINSKDYDIPQNRERVYIVSIRNDKSKIYEFPEPIPLTLTLRDILLPDVEPPILHNIYGGFKEKKPRIFNDYSPTIRTAKGGGHIPSVRISNVEEKIDKIIKNIDINKLEKSREIIKLGNINPSGKGMGGCVYSDLGISPTITLNKGEGHKILIVNGEEFKMRSLEPLECFRLQGFDDKDWFILEQNGISKTMGYQLAGNTITINVLEAIFKKLFNKA